MRTMDVLAVPINAVVVAVVGGIVAWLFMGRFDALDSRLTGHIVSVDTRLDGQIESLGSRLDGRIDSLEARLDRRFDSLDACLDGRFDTLQSSVDAMRSDLTQVALAVGIHPRARND